MARALGLVLLILAVAVTASAQTAPPTLGLLVNQVVALFPRVNAEVIEVQGGTVTLSLGQRDGLVAGIELSLYREGRELRHPKTGEVLGRTEPGQSVAFDHVAASSVLLPEAGAVAGAEGPEGQEVAAGQAHLTGP